MGLRFNLLSLRAAGIESAGTLVGRLYILCLRSWGAHGCLVVQSRCDPLDCCRYMCRQFSNGSESGAGAGRLLFVEENAAAADYNYDDPRCRLESTRRQKALHHHQRCQMYALPRSACQGRMSQGSVAALSFLPLLPPFMFLPLSLPMLA